MRWIGVLLISAAILCVALALSFCFPHFPA